jgi:3-hydroxyacyl-[acyl-carrier-protein] dehydratase
MLEALVQAGAWLLRVKEGFAYSTVVLREARGVKYGNFVEPGRQLRLTAEWQSQNGSCATFKGKGEVDGSAAVSARLVLERYNLQERRPELRPLDDQITSHFRLLYRTLGPAPQGSSRETG